MQLGTKREHTASQVSSYNVPSQFSELYKIYECAHKTTETKTVSKTRSK